MISGVTLRTASKVLVDPNLLVSHALNEVANYVERIALVVQGGFRIGPVDEILTEETLRQMYGIPVDVERFHGHRVVLARRRPATTPPRVTREFLSSGDR